VSEQIPAAGPAETPQGNAITRWFKGQSTMGKVRTVGVGLLVVVGGPIAFIAAQGAPSAANVGDCMNGQTAETLKKVDCTDPTAEWVVVGRLSDQTEAQFDNDSCAEFPTTAFAYWEGEQGKPGFVLCLEEK
jgi:hypothetical protein